MKVEDLVFPVTLKAFIAFQEAGMGRELEPMEREAIAAWVKLFNLAYADGAREDSTVLARDLCRVDKCLSECGNDAILTQILSSFRWWIEYAWQLGFKEAGKVAAV